MENEAVEKVGGEEEAENKRQGRYETIDLDDDDIKILEGIWDDLAEEEAAKRKAEAEAQNSEGTADAKE